VNQIILDLQDNVLSQLINYPTRGSKILDLFITSLIESCNTIDGISDHEVLVRRCHPVRRSVYLSSRANFDQIRQEIQSFCEEFTATNSYSTCYGMTFYQYVILA